MSFKWRKWLRIIHRDFGYIFTGVTLIYALSGIALNHNDDWDPSYSISIKKFELNKISSKQEITKAWIEEFLKTNGEEGSYKKHFWASDKLVKVFLRTGNAYFDFEENTATIELLKKRPVFYQVNYLHYNPQRWWTWFSDIYAGALIILAISGLFLIKGKNGITGRGAWLTAIGLAIPILFLIFL